MQPEVLRLWVLFGGSNDAIRRTLVRHITEPTVHVTYSEHGMKHETNVMFLDSGRQWFEDSSVPIRSDEHSQVK